jgi:hypothetical protein
MSREPEVAFEEVCRAQLGTVPKGFTFLPDRDGAITAGSPLHEDAWDPGCGGKGPLQREATSVQSEHPSSHKTQACPVDRVSPKSGVKFLR